MMTLFNANGDMLDNNNVDEVVQLNLIEEHMQEDNLLRACQRNNAEEVIQNDNNGHHVIQPSNIDEGKSQNNNEDALYLQNNAPQNNFVGKRIQDEYDPSYPLPFNQIKIEDAYFVYLNQSIFDGH